MSLLKNLPGAIKSIVTLRKATRGTKISAGIGAALVLAIGIGVQMGYIETADAAEFFDLAATIITCLIAASEYLGKRNVQKGVGAVQEELNAALAPGSKLKVDEKPGPVTQSAARAVANATSAPVRPPRGVIVSTPESRARGGRAG